MSGSSQRPGNSFCIILLSKRKFLILCQIISLLKATLSHRSTWTSVPFSAERSRLIGHCQRRSAQLGDNFSDPSERDDWRVSFTILVSVKFSNWTNLFASVERKILLGRVFLQGRECRSSRAGLQVTPSEKLFWKLRQGREHWSTSTWAVSQLQLEMETWCILEDSHPAPLQRKGRVASCRDATASPPSVTSDPAFQMEERNAVSWTGPGLWRVPTLFHPLGCWSWRDRVQRAAGTRMGITWN